MKITLISTEFGHLTSLQKNISSKENSKNLQLWSDFSKIETTENKCHCSEEFDVVCITFLKREMKKGRKGQRKN